MNINQLAKELNVTVADVESLMQKVCTSISQDDAVELTTQLSESELTEFISAEFISAYVESEVKKFSEFCITLLTNTEKRSAFDQYLMHNM